MHAKAEKPKENESRAVANAVAQKKNNVKQGFGFADNSPENLKQMEIQRMISIHSPFQKKLPPACNEQAIQRTTWSWVDGVWVAQDQDEPQTEQPARDGRYPWETIDTGIVEDTDSEEVVAPPDGYTLTTDSTGSTAYVANPNGWEIGNVATDHIVEVANGARETHRSDKMKGTDIETYVHPSDHELYTVTIQGAHTDGIPMITVHEQGKVRGGWHRFKKK